MKKDKRGFIYIWKDMKRNKYYIGSHQGSDDDGYIGSNKRFQCAYKSRPETFRRKILEYVEFTKHKELLDRENYWLSMINSDELFTKYYNEKKVAAGGDIVSNLSEEKRKLHKERSIAARQKGYEKWVKDNPEKTKQRAKLAGKISGEKNKGKNLKVKETLATRKEIDAFMTPIGPRSFLTLAAKELGISYPTLRKRIDNEVEGYYWINKTKHFYK